MNPAVGGVGASAMEALAAGLVVLADVSRVDPAAARWIPDPPIVDVRSARDLTRALTKLVRDRDHLEHERGRSLAWARRYLTPQFTHDYYAACFA